MTVKEIFDLRKQGHIEEAYDAIRPMYKVHKGYYTSLCMYLCARDVFNIRLAEGKLDEATKIYPALKRLAPTIEDKDGTVAAFIDKAGKKLPAPMRGGAILSEFPAPVRGGARGGVELNKGQSLVLEAIKANEGINVPCISEATGIPSKSIERHIKALLERDLITHQGSKKTGGYYAK